MEIKQQYEEDGYNITEYTNGSVVRIPICGNINIPELPKEYSKQDIVNAQILTQLEYLTCLQELNSMKGGNL